MSAVAGTITGDCNKSQTFTVTATDDCGGLTDVKTVTYTWTEDTQAPVLTVPTTGLALGCNPTALPTRGKRGGSFLCNGQLRRYRVSRRRNHHGRLQ